MKSSGSVKILVLGDSGVGKTSLTHLICNGEVLSKPSWTIGASVNVKLHKYREGTREESLYYVEFTDVGGCSQHSGSRHIFYRDYDGIILVHDLTNRKSLTNLRRWLLEALARDSYSKVNEFEGERLDEEGLLDQLPVLVVGTRLDQVLSHSGEESEHCISVPTPPSPGLGSSHHHSTSSLTSPDQGTSGGSKGTHRVRKNRPITLADELGLDEIKLSCMTPIKPGTSASVTLSKFFDNLIDFSITPTASSRGLGHRASGMLGYGSGCALQSVYVPNSSLTSPSSTQPTWSSDSQAMKHTSKLLPKSYKQS